MAPWVRAVAEVTGTGHKLKKPSLGGKVQGSRSHETLYVRPRAYERLIRTHKDEMAPLPHEGVLHGTELEGWKVWFVTMKTYEMTAAHQLRGQDWVSIRALARRYVGRERR